MLKNKNELLEENCITLNLSQHEFDLLQFIEHLSKLTPEHLLIFEQTIGILNHLIEQYLDQQTTLFRGTPSDDISSCINSLDKMISFLQKWDAKFDQLTHACQTQNPKDRDEILSTIYSGKCIIVNDIIVLFRLKTLFLSEQDHTNRYTYLSALRNNHDNLCQYSQPISTVAPDATLNPVYFSIQKSCCESLCILIQQQKALFKRIPTNEKKTLIESYTTLLKFIVGHNQDDALSFLNDKIVPLLRDDLEFFQELLQKIQSLQHSLPLTDIENALSLQIQLLTPKTTSHSKQVKKELQLTLPGSPKKKHDLNKKKPSKKKSQNSHKPLPQMKIQSVPPAKNKTRQTRSKQKKQKPHFPKQNDSDTPPVTKPTEPEFFEELSFTWEPPYEKKSKQRKNPKRVTTTPSTASNHPHAFFKPCFIELYLFSATIQLQDGKDDLQQQNYQDAVKKFTMIIDRDIAKIKSSHCPLTLDQEQKLIELESDALYLLLDSYLQTEDFPHCQQVTDKIYLTGTQYSKKRNNSGVIFIFEPLDQQCENVFKNFHVLDDQTLLFWFTMKYHLTVALFNKNLLDKAENQYQKLLTLHEALQKKPSLEQTARTFSEDCIAQLSQYIGDKPLQKHAKKCER
jgi:hypothetical protein